VEETSELGYNRNWRMAVWALRAGYLGLAVGATGLILLLLGSTPWVLAVGVMVWLVAAVVALTGFLGARHELAQPRPGFWSMRFMLIGATLHSRSPGRPDDLPGGRLARGNRRRDGQ
jgi:hypothetical protein